MAADPLSLDELNGDALLQVIERGLTLLGGQPLDEQVDDGELTETAARLHRIETTAAAEKLRRIAEVDARQAWRGEGARSTADLLADGCT